jgi:RNA polymerase sigma-70 factor (ECF subfamily)
MSPRATESSKPRQAEQVQSLAGLLKRAREGCPQAIGTLCEQHQDFLLRAVHHFLTPEHTLRNELDSDDLAQEAWRRILRALNQGQVPDVPEDYLRYLFSIVRTTFLKLYRDHITSEKRSLLREVPLNPALHDQPATGDAGADPAEFAAAADAWEHWLGGLPERDREVLRLIRAGERRDEIATRLDVSERTVARVLHQLRRKLAASDVRLAERWYAERNWGSKT